MAEGKRKRAKYSRDNTARNAKRQAARVAKKFGNKGNYRDRGVGTIADLTARAKRRATGDFHPVNEVASLTQAPQGKFARSISKQDQQKILGTFVPKTKAEEAALAQFTESN